MKKSWWPPGLISFTKAQVLFLLQHIIEFAPDGWPEEHRESGYVGGKSNKRHRAPYEMPACIWSDLRQRIESAGQDGLWLEMAYSQSNYTSRDIAIHIASGMQLDPDNVERSMNSALRYISGKCPRWLDCPGAGKCVECAKCPKSKERDGKLKCTKLPRKARTYEDFKAHK